MLTGYKIAKWPLLSAAILFCSCLSIAHAQGNKMLDMPKFVSMLPHFTINLGDGTFLQMEAQTFVRTDETGEALQLHMPAVRHSIILYLSDLFPEDLRTAQQRENLREDIARLIREALVAKGLPAEIKGFFITSLIMQ